MGKRDLRWRYLFIYALLSLLLIAFVEIVVTHGGLKGDVEYSIVGNPPRRVLAYPDREPILFNRWLIADEHKPYVLRALVALCWPSFQMAGVFGSMLPKWNRNFAYAFPYGMSFDSYEYLAAFSLSLLQWFVIGYLAELVTASQISRSAKPKCGADSSTTGLRVLRICVHFGHPVIPAKKETQNQAMITSRPATLEAAWAAL